jgi:hypothetical protein
MTRTEIAKGTKKLSWIRIQLWSRNLWQRGDVDNLGYLAFSILYVVVGIACGLYYCSIVPSPDQSLYDYIAWQGTQGIAWYTGSVDVSWPGPFLLHDLGIRIFGVHRWTARLTDFILLQPAIAGMLFFLRTAGLRFAAVAIVIAYPVIYVTSGGWQAGHRDIVGMHFLIAASAVLLTDGTAWRGRFLAGVILGYAIMLRPTYLAFAPFLLVAAALGRPFDAKLFFTRALVPLSLGTLAVPLAFAAAGLLMGNLWDWFDEGIRFVLSVYQVDESRFRLFGMAWTVISQPMGWLAIAGALGGCVWVINASVIPTHLCLMVGMVSTVWISYFVQNKGFGYHLGGLIPLLTLLALGAPELAQRTKRIREASCAATLCVVVILCAGLARRTQHYVIPFFAHLKVSDPTTFQDQVPSTNEAVAIVTSESGPHDRFFQWGWNSDVGYLSRRLSASRYVFPLFAQIDETHLNYISWIAEFGEELERTKPKFILLDLTTVPTSTNTDKLPIVLPSGSSKGLNVLISVLNRNYIVRARWSDKILFKRAS